MTADNFTVEIENHLLPNHSFYRTFNLENIFGDKIIEDQINFQYYLNNKSSSNETNLQFGSDIFSSVATDKSTQDKMNIDKWIDVLGENMQRLDGCLAECSNKGKCIYDTIKKSFKCQCFPNFTGELCQINLDPCSTLQCLNYGKCISFENNYFHCICTKISYGKRCENIVNVCQNRSCSNNGICQPTSLKANCKCFKNFFGDNCEFETQEQILIKKIRKASLIISICVILTLILFFICLDIASLFGIDSKDRKKSHSKKNKMFKC